MTQRSILFRSIAGGIILMGVAAASAAPLKVDTSKSSVKAVFKQLNVPVEARFHTIAAQIEFDGAKPDATKANIDIDIASFDLGEADYNKEVLKKEWFDAAHFPKATFTASSVKTASTGATYNVTGKLLIKGKTANVQFPLTVKKEGGGYVFDGALPIRRLTFNIGEGEWKDTSMVADEVTIKFHIVTTP